MLLMYSGDHCDRSTLCGADLWRRQRQRQAQRQAVGSTRRLTAARESCIAFFLPDVFRRADRPRLSSRELSPLAGNSSTGISVCQP